ncbi:MAG: hypothetical protein K2M11_00240 [Paramuribaculum sp.]|nr:hypothetical protein [Paramuribaculum sp.]
MTHANSISFDLAWYTILSQYSSSVRRTVCDAVLNFAVTGEIPVLKGIAKVAFQFISHEISKQLGRASSERLSLPLNPSADVETAGSEVVNVAEIQSEESSAVAVNESGLTESQTAEEEPVTPSLETQPVESVPAINDNRISVQEAFQQETPAFSPDLSQLRHSAVPSSPARKQRGCISRNRMQVGKITCMKKGSKMLFRRR